MKWDIIKAPEGRYIGTYGNPVYCVKSHHRHLRVPWLFCSSAVESHKVVPICFWQSLVKSCRSSSEHTQAVARPPTRNGGLIDRSARIAGLPAYPSTRLS